MTGPLGPNRRPWEMPRERKRRRDPSEILASLTERELAMRAGRCMGSSSSSTAPFTAPARPGPEGAL